LQKIVKKSSREEVENFQAGLVLCYLIIGVPIAKWISSVTSKMIIL